MEAEFVSEFTEASELTSERVRRMLRRIFGGDFGEASERVRRIFGSDFGELGLRSEFGDASEVTSAKLRS